MSLAAAFGNEPAYWMEADVAYRLSLAEQDEEIVRRGRLFEMATYSRHEASRMDKG